MLPPRLDVLLPFWGMAGGVIKVLDYAHHAAELGIETKLWAPAYPAALGGDTDNPIFSVPVVSQLHDHPRVTICPIDELSMTPHATVLFTEVTHHRLIERATAATGPLGARLIHLVQGTRHANPAWNDGLNYRLLHRPMTRIAVSTPVADAIAPLVHPKYETTTIPEGHHWQYFLGRSGRAGAHEGPLRVLYTTWKSDLGRRVHQAILTAGHGDRVACIAVTTPLGWPALRNRYHGADVLLCTPGPEEGFYLPGLEAMAAGTCSITALVGGNAEYVRADENALVVPYNDVAAHVDAIIQLERDRQLLSTLVAGGQETLLAHDLQLERQHFGELLSRVDGM